MFRFFASGPQCILVAIIPASWLQSQHEFSLFFFPLSKNRSGHLLVLESCLCINSKHHHIFLQSWSKIRMSHGSFTKGQVKHTSSKRGFWNTYSLDCLAGVTDKFEPYLLSSAFSTTKPVQLLHCCKSRFKVPVFSVFHMKHNSVLGFHSEVRT